MKSHGKQPFKRRPVDKTIQSHESVEMNNQMAGDLIRRGQEWAEFFKEEPFAAFRNKKRLPTVSHTKFESHVGGF
jgi:hypothetical protein